MDLQGNELIRRIPSSTYHSRLSYEKSISEKSAELEYFYRERKLIYEENARQEEIVLRPVAIPEDQTSALDEPFESLFYFAPESQINREIRKLEDAMEARERHTRAKAAREKTKTAVTVKMPIKLRKFAANRSKKSISTPSSDKLALPQTPTLPLSQDVVDPIDQPRKKIMTLRSRNSKLDISKEKKTVEEMMMAHLQSIPKIPSKPRKSGKTILLHTALPSSAPKIGNKRRREASNSNSTKKAKTPSNNFDEPSKLNDHGSVFDQFGKGSVPETSVPEDEPMIEKPTPQPKVDEPTSKEDKSKIDVDPYQYYLDDFDDSDTETENQNDSLLADTSPGSPTIASSPHPIRPPNLKDTPVSTDSGKDSDESVDTRSPTSTSPGLPSFSLREPETIMPTNIYAPKLPLFEDNQSIDENIQKSRSNHYSEEEVSDIEERVSHRSEVDPDSDNDVVFVDARNKFDPQDVVTIEDSDTEEINDTGPDLEIISCDHKDIVDIDQIKSGDWLDVRRLPLGFQFHVGQKIKYGKLS